jgi:tRNA A-37 threonylcarbamoyl transferase component Bud32
MSGEGAEWLIGQVLEGRFRVERLLGEGGMGRVYAAEELRLRRRCALKVLLPEVAEDPAGVERFLREAQAIAQLHHDSIVDVYHLGEDQALGVVFFAMELLEGEDLEGRLEARAQRPISWALVCQWGVQIAGAMAVVHASGLVHRDLKPSNVFLIRRRDGREQVKLLDFGIAKVVSYAAGAEDIGGAKTIQQAALTSTGAAIGTPYYMSPEQILGERVDPRTDIYSLGVVLYEALAGRLPFVGEPMQVAMQHCNVEAPSLSSLGLAWEVPVELELLVMKMLAKDAVSRPQTMDEVEAALAGMLPADGPGVVTMRAAEAGPKPSPSMSPTLVFHGASLARAPRAAARLPAARARDGARRWLLPLVASGVLALLVVVVMLVGGDDGASQAPSEGATRQAPPSGEPAPAPTPIAPAAAVSASAEDPAGGSTGGSTDGSTGGSTDGSTDGSTAEVAPVAPTKRPTKGADRTTDPLKLIAAAAAACRRRHQAVGGPKVVVDYVIGSDGAVTRATPMIQGGLGECLAAAVKKASFPPGLKLGQKIEL